MIAITPVAAASGPAAVPSQPAASRPAATAPAIEGSLVLRVFTLEHIDPKTAANAIGTALGDQNVRVTTGAGSIVVRTNPAAMASVEQLIRLLDVAPDESREITRVIVPLQKAQASELAAVIPRLFPDLRECLAWPAANSLLLAGPSRAVETARTLIEKLDTIPLTPKPPPVPPPTPEPPQPPPRRNVVTKLIPLRHADPSDAIINALRSAAGRDTSIVVDQNTRSLIVTAPPAAVDVIQGLIAQIDQPTTRPETPVVRLRVRFLWLLGGLPEDKSAPPPADLLPLMEELQRMGVTGLRLAAQSVVEGMPGSTFRLKATPMLANRCDLLLEGRILDRAGSQPSVELSAQAIEHAPYMEPEKSGYKVFETRELCSLQTTVATPLGKTVVAGLTPVDRMTAVFVIQVLPQ